MKKYTIIIFLLVVTKGFGQIQSDTVSYLDIKPIQYTAINAPGEESSEIYEIEPEFCYVSQYESQRPDIQLSRNQSPEVSQIPMIVDVASTGATVVTIPIEIPKGSAGLEPTLTLTYSSTSGNGIAGYGWNIGGLSTIYNRSMNYFYDGYVAPTSDNTESFMLDGKRLIHESGSIYYLEGSQKSVRAVRNMSSMTVYYNNGTVANYDDIAGSKIMQLYRVKDRFGNYINYEYETGNRYRYLTKISYGSEQGTFAGRFAMIEFTYESRDDENLFFNIGKEITIKKRLKKIITGEREYILNYTGGYYSLLSNIQCKGTNGTPSISLSSLSFSYGIDGESGTYNLIKNENTLLDYATEGGYETLQTLTGQYDYGYTGEGVVTYPNKSIYTWGKLKGDSHYSLHSMYHSDDIIFLAPTFEKAKTSYYKFKAGEGFRGAINLDTDNNQKTQEVVLINSKSHYLFNFQTVKFRIIQKVAGLTYRVEKEVSYNLPAYFSDLSYYSVTPITYHTGDFRGDGREMIFGIQPYVDKISTETKIYLFNHNKTGVYYGYKPTFTIESEDKVLFLDYDGDGKTDIFHFHNNGFDVYGFSIVEPDNENKLDFTLVKLASSSSITRKHFNEEYKKTTIAGTTYARRNVLFGDINGDGKLDVLATSQYGKFGVANTPIALNGYTWTQCLSIGEGKFQVSTYDMPENIWINTYRDVLFHDFNGDGRSDIVCIKDNNLQVIHSNGKRIDPALINTYALGDLDADGKLFTVDLKRSNHNRILGYIKKDKIVKLSLSANEKVNTFLTKAQNSLGQSTSLSYFRIDTNGFHEEYGNIYSPGYWAEYPFTNFNGYYWVTTTLKSVINNPEDSGNKQTVKDIRYLYNNAVVHKQGLGFCGFKEISTLDNLTGYKSKAVYDPFNWGILEKMDTRDQTIENDFSIEITDKKEPIIRLTKQKITDKLTENELTVENEYDTFGQVTKTITDYGDDIKEEKNISYNNIISDQLNLIGLPLTTEVKRIRGADTYKTSQYVTYNDKHLPGTIVSKTNDKVTKTVKYEYDRFSNVTKETSIPYEDNEREFINYYTYSPNGRFLIGLTNELGLTTTYSYDNNNRLESEEDSKGNLTKYEYDALNRIIKTTYPDGSISEIKRNTTYKFGTSHVVEITSNYKPDEIYYYDQLGRVIVSGEKRIDGNYLYTRNIYNERGLISKTSLPFKGEEPSHYNAYVYDDFDRLTAINYASGKKDSYSYDKNKVTSVIDNILATKIYDVTGQLIQVDDNAGTIKYDLRPDGQPNFIKVPESVLGEVITKFTYDSYGRILSIEDPSSGLQSTRYDTAGNIAEKTDGKGSKIKMFYDEYNRIISKQYETHENNMNTVYTYNDDGLVTNISLNNGTSRSFIYDRLNRDSIIKEIGLDGKFLLKKIGYNKQGNTSSVKYESQSESIISENFKYKNGNLQGIYHPYSAIAIGPGDRPGLIIPTSVTELPYDPVKPNPHPGVPIPDPESEPWPNPNPNPWNPSFPSIEAETKYGDPIWEIVSENDMGLPTEIKSGKIVRKYQYDEFGLPINRRAAYSGSREFFSHSYQFDPQTSNLTWKKDNIRNKQEDFEYDEFNRLTSYGNKSIAYEANGNIWNKSDVGFYSYYHIPDQFGSGGLISPIKQNPYAVADIGNIGMSLGSRPLNANQIIEYTSFQRPSYLYEGDANHDLAVSFTYNDNYDRLKTDITKNGKTFSRHYLGGRYEIDIENGKSLERLYLGGDAYSAPEVYIKDDAGKWNSYYIFRDYLGSILMVTNNSGTIQQELSFDAWGNLRDPETYDIYDKGDEPKLLLGRGYTGHEHLQELRLINMNARLYDPEIARFLSPDPYVQMPDFSQNFNRYSYALNNPLKYTDPNGEFFFSFIPVVGTIIDGACWGALIGAGGGALSYSIGAAFTGSWDWSSFGKSLGMGAVGGAIGGSFGAAGAAGAFGSFGNTLGYNMLGQVSNTVITNSIFDNDFSWGNMLGTMTGATVGAFFPSFKGVNGSLFKNAVSEIGFNTLRGSVTGFSSGLINALIEKDADYMWQGMAGGALSGASRSLLMNIGFGAPIKATSYYVDDNGNETKINSLLRSGGIINKILDGDVSLGKYAISQGTNNRQHETMHVYQQNQIGWANFYGRTLIEYAKALLGGRWGDVYGTPGTLENDADSKMFKHIKIVY